MRYSPPREYRVPHPVLTNLLTSGEDVYLLIHQFLYPLSLGLYLTVAYGLPEYGPPDCGLPMKLLGLHPGLWVATLETP